jgi:hypothetical protein
VKRKDNTFIKITNSDIYDVLTKMNYKLESIDKQNVEDHNGIMNRLDRTNGKVKLSFWIATTAMTLITVIIYLLFNHINK